MFGLGAAPIALYSAKTAALAIDVHKPQATIVKPQSVAARFMSVLSKKWSLIQELANAKKLAAVPLPFPIDSYRGFELLVNLLSKNPFGSHTLRSTRQLAQFQSHPADFVDFIDAAPECQSTSPSGSSTADG